MTLFPCAGDPGLQPAPAQCKQDPRAEVPATGSEGHSVINVDASLTGQLLQGARGRVQVVIEDNQFP